MANENQAVEQETKNTEEGKCERAPAMKTKVRFYKLAVVIAIALAFVVPLGGVAMMTAGRAAEYQNYQDEQAALYKTVRAKFAQLYSDIEAEMPVENVSEEQLDEVQELLERIKAKEYLADKNAMLAKLETLREFLPVRDAVLVVFDGEAMKSATTAEEITKLKEEVAGLAEGQQEVLVKRIETLETQRVAIEELRTAVADLFANGDVRADATQAQYQQVAEKLEALPQEDVKAELRPQVEKAKVELDRRAEEARKAAEEARRKREAEIAAAWKTMNVPYISQNQQEIFNGCEAAAVLMGLQYKGYLRGMGLRQYVEMMPKSTDPNQGFTYSVYDLEPKTAPHWIAPAPLAKFARESSGASVQDVTGSSLAQLKNEVVSGNPVVIYLTYLYREPKEWVEGAPKNIHVMLMTGYNSLTNEIQMTDPWTGADGQKKYVLPWTQVESLFNRTGKRAVVVRG